MILFGLILQSFMYLALSLSLSLFLTKEGAKKSVKKKFDVFTPSIVCRLLLFSPSYIFILILLNTTEELTKKNIFKQHY